MGVRAYRVAVEVVVEPDHPAYDAVGAVPDRTDAYSQRYGIVQHVLITGEERTAAEHVHWLPSSSPSSRRKPASPNRVVSSERSTRKSISEPE
jgi:hypothetical protein